MPSDPAFKSITVPTATLRALKEIAERRSMQLHMKVSVPSVIEMLIAEYEAAQ